MDRNGIKEYLRQTFLDFDEQSFRKTFRMAILGMMIFSAGGLFFLTICVAIMLLTNIIQPSDPLVYEVVEFSPCSGWSNSGLAEKKEVFRPDEAHIFACGRIETNRPIVLIVFWYYEGQQLHRDVISGVKDQFLSELPYMGKDFPEGNYELRLYIGKETAGRAEFKVASPEE